MDPAIDITPVDDRSEKNIATLLPEVQVLARSLVHAANNMGIDIKVISGTRSDEEQHCIFLQGRKPLNVVNAARKEVGLDPITEADNVKRTNCDSGQSNHNFEIAFDIGVFDGKHFFPESPVYKAVGVLGKQLGLFWGGDFKSFQDEPHFELRPAFAANMSEKDMLAELRSRKASGQSFFA
jgi:peptidoglycan LD-endopeptidase CwlK